MKECLNKALWLLMIIIFPLAPYAQKDVTQFLDIPVDGYKPEMIEKLQSRGYAIIPESKDILEGEFNGTEVNIFFTTNNNKVWRIGIFDKNPTDEINIKIRFNTLVQQFVNNNRYATQPDSTISEFIISEDEDISYNMTVNNKRYQAVFYQKVLKCDSLANEIELLEEKEEFDDQDVEKFTDLTSEWLRESMNSLNKTVWFMIKEEYGEYRIIMFYENNYNEANGSGL